MKRKERLGDILIRKGYITQEQLENALRAQEFEKKLLGKILITRGVITEKQMLEVLAEQFDLRVVDVDIDSLDLTLADMFTKSLIVDHRYFPIQKTNDKIVMAINDPLDAWAGSEAANQGQYRKIERVLVSELTMDKILARYRDYRKAKMKKLFGDY